MKTTSFILVLAAILSVPCAHAGKKSDPIVMTVGGKKVPLSEFEYLYGKNNEQQQESTTLDEYVEMFADYKRKVLAAESAGLDTMPEFVRDYNRYRVELAHPYMRDKAVDDSLKKVAYAHLLENVSVNHILIPASTGDRTHEMQKALMDSLRAEIASGADFKEVAKKYSADPMAKQTGGEMGFIQGGMYPYEFEDMAYRTPVGAISPVFETMFGLHLIQVVDRRPDIGQVKARHILKMTRGLDETGVLKKQQEADSIYEVLIKGADFKDVAMRETEDPSGKANGGELPWFGAGRMVKEFEQAAFSLPDNGISKPVKSTFGYHIILKEGHKAVDTYEAMEKNLDEMLKRDFRGEIAAQRKLAACRVMWKGEVVADTRTAVADVLKSHGGLNGDSRKALSALSGMAVKLGKKSGAVADVVKLMPVQNIADAGKALTEYDRAANKVLDDMVSARMIDELPANETDYGNLLNEYRDGMLLYEISNREVWGRANTDVDGLQDYFERHRSDFAWTVPHYRGYIVAAESDSIADAALAFLKEANPGEGDLSTELRKKFGTKAKIERVVTAKGASKIVDHVGFGMPAPNELSKGRWVAYRPYQGEVLEQPQNAMDVKGPVSMAYQQELEEKWIKGLKAAYPHKVNRKVLGSIRRK